MDGESTPAEFLVLPRWLLPVEPAGSVLEDHALAVAHGRILAIGPAAELVRRYPDAERLQRPDHVLMPGLVNAHTHAGMTLLRGYSDDLPLMRWLQDHVWPAETEHVTADFVHDGTLLACAEFLRGGVTCFNDMYFYPDAVARAASSAGLRASVSMIVLDFPSAWASGPKEYLSKGLAVRDRYKDHPSISTNFGPHAPYTVGDEALRRVRELADELEVPVQMHMHETAGEVADAVAKDGRRPLARLEALGLLTPLLQAVHMTQLEAEEIALLAERGVSVIHCPESNLKLASGFCPVARLAEAGVNLALGTDGAASNNDLDLFGEMRTAALLAKAVADDAAALPARDALEMATLGGARAMGLAADTGSLVAGKWADMICMDLSDIETRPNYDLISTLVYAASRSQVTDTWVAGRQLLAERRLTSLDEHELTEIAERWQTRIATTRTERRGGRA